MTTLCGDVTPPCFSLDLIVSGCRVVPNNWGLRGFEAIDAAKKVVEKAYPGVVLASNVLQFAACDSVILNSRLEDTGGPCSQGTTIAATMPSPHDDAATLLKHFQSWSLNIAQLVMSLKYCESDLRGVEFRFMGGVRPALGHCFFSDVAKLAASIESTGLVCSRLSKVTHGALPMVCAPKRIINRRGLLTSDQTLLQDSRTKGHVYANSGLAFYCNFGDAMVAMSCIDVLTGHLGEIRRAIIQVN